MQPSSFGGCIHDPRSDSLWGVLYILITLAQVLDRPAIVAEGIAVVLVLAVATAYYHVEDEHRLHASEIAFLWAAVLLFLVYGTLKYGGVL